MNWRYPFEQETRITWAGSAPHDEIKSRWVWWADDYLPSILLVVIGVGLILFGMERAL